MSQSGLRVSEIAPGILNFGEQKDWGVAAGSGAGNHGPILPNWAAPPNRSSATF